MTSVSYALERHHRRVLRRQRDNPLGSFRADVEGLRAYAVGLVVLDHLVGWPAGGFIGVDVFFVISGFLITGLLLKESEQRGRLSFRTFYTRRARRILPGAIATLAVVWIAAHVAFSGPRLKDTVDDIWWSLGFSANIHFADLGTNYFDQTRAASPVQHFWSLAVEEQFYVVWPIVVLLVVSVICRRFDAVTKRIALLGVATAITIASFAWALTQTQNHPTDAYFATTARAWELGVGAILAVVSAQWPHVTDRLGRHRATVTLSGLVVVVASAFVVKSSPGFPAPWAALPVLATAAVIAAGIGTPLDGGLASPLTNPVSRYLGRISYSLYLWHWPVIVFVHALVPDDTAVFYPLIVTAMFSLTVLSYHLVETPLRNARSWRIRRPQFTSEQQIPALIGLSLVAVTGVLWVLQPPPATPEFLSSIDDPAPTSSATTTKPADPTVATPTPAQATAITNALRATTWPDLDIPVDTLTGDSAREEWGYCDNTSEETLSRCTFGAFTSASKVAVVIGDSFAMAWMPAVRDALVSRGWIVYGLAGAGCTASDVPMLGGTPEARLTDCDTRHQWAVAKTLELNPSLVLVASATNTLNRLASGAEGSAAIAEYQAGLQRTITSLQPSATRRVLTLAPPPTGKSFADCYTPRARPSDCVSTISDTWTQMVAAERSVAAATSTAYLDSHLWFCTDEYCPAFVGTTPIRWDGQHLTGKYARSLAGQLWVAIDAALR